MGYDLHRLDADFTHVPNLMTYDQLRAEVPKDWWEDPRADLGADNLPNRFHRNIFGMSRLTETLQRLGLGYPVAEFPQPDWKAAHAVEEAWCEQWNAEHPDADPDTGADFDAWHELSGAEKRKLLPDHYAALSWAQPDTPGICLNKLIASNDGWIVTAPEYRSMLGLYDRLTEQVKAELALPNHSGFGSDFLAFARACARTHGASETW